jgi:photosystem II stability/assembly factor-like uncharacterized protein
MKSFSLRVLSLLVVLLSACEPATALPTQTISPPSPEATPIALVVMVQTSPTAVTPTTSPESNPFPQVTLPAAYPPYPPLQPTLMGVYPPPAPPSHPWSDPYRQILDFSFVDPQHGWLLDSGCDKCISLGMFSTRDGGRTWQPEKNSLGKEIIQNWHQGIAESVPSISYIDLETGWVYNPGLWSTHDGGLTWDNENPDGQIVDLQSLGKSVWAIKAACLPGIVGLCNFNLITLAPDGGTWEPLAELPTISGQQVQLLRLDRENAYILSWGMRIEGGPSADLIVTHNSGATWKKVTSPFESGCPVTARISAPGNRTLWAICGGEPGAGQQLKSLFISKDDGMTWVKQPDPPSSGYLDDFVAVSPARAFLGLGRGTLMVTQDSGQNWNPAIDKNVANQEDFSGWRIKFSDRMNGWASLFEQLFHTTNGGQTWKLEIVRELVP